MTDHADTIRRDEYSLTEAKALHELGVRNHGWYMTEVEHRGVLDVLQRLEAERRQAQEERDALRERVDMARKREVHGEASLNAASEAIDTLTAQRRQAIDALRWLYSEGIGRMPMFNQTNEQRVAYANGLLRYIEEALGRVKLGEKP